MTTYTLDPATPAELRAENARLRLTVAHLAVYGRAVLDCRDNGGLTLAHQGYPAYQARHAMAALEEYVTKVLAGDCPPLRPEQIAAAWERHAKHPLWGEEYMTRERWQAAVNDLLWHPERQAAASTAPTLPVDGTVGFADEIAGLSRFHQSHD